MRGFHHYGGNRGPLCHGADKIEKEPSAADKAASWFYSKAQGGGSLLDYMGYGTTLGTWHLGGKAPLEVTGVWDEPAGLEVDEHAVAIIRYSFGLSKSETRWGTFTDPWTHQPQPKCGFVLKGTSGTISTPVGTNSANFTTPALTSTTNYWVRVINSSNPTPAFSDTATVTVGLELWKATARR